MRAWVDHGSQRYFSESTTASPFGALFILVNGIYERLGSESWRVLRQRMYTSGSATKSQKCLIKVAAKRCSFDMPCPPELIGSPPRIDVSTAPIVDSASQRLLELRGKILSGKEAESLCLSLIGSIPLQPERFQSHRPIAAILLGPEMKLLAAHVNTNALNRLRHAEINLMSQHWLETGAPIPRGSRLYTTLSPCLMCAALIEEFSEDGAALRVITAAFDRGTHGNHQSLSNVSLFDSPGS